VKTPNLKLPTSSFSAKVEGSLRRRRRLYVELGFKFQPTPMESPL
jgi:hypothetical protein